MLDKILPLEFAAPSSADVLRLDADGKLALTADSFAGQRVAMLGTSGMGKTNTLALLLEKMLPYIPGVIFDQHDEFWGLCEQYEILRVGKSPESQLKAGPEQAAKIAEISHSKRLSVLVEMLHMTRQERQDFVEAYCAAIWELNKRAKLPYAVVLEEAQNFIPEGKSTPAQEMMKQFALEGRKFGFTIFISTQRSAEVSKTVLGQCGLAFLHGVDIYADVQAYAGMLPYSATETKKIALNLGVGECIVKVKADGRAQFIHPVKMLRRSTFHVGDTPTLDQETAPPLRAIDGDLLKELQAVLKAAPAAEAHVADKPLPLLYEAHIDSYIADLRAKLVDAQRDLTRVQAQPPVTTSSGSIYKPVSNGLIAHVAARDTVNPAPAPAADVQLKPTSDEWDGRSELATQRAKNLQKRQHQALLTDIQRSDKMHRLILVYLTQRENLEIGERDLARSTGYSRSSIENHRPTAFERRGLIRRIARAGTYFYQSTARTFFKANYPDLDIDDLVQEICKLEKL